ncbi:MAG: thioredoxin domain-containing protein [Verrucomicrobiota bacterium]|nr:thioredoxin domain-containing protein [Verrucomicrobiota bacterium]
MYFFCPQVFISPIFLSLVLLMGCSNKSRDPEQNENNSTVQGSEKNMSENKVLESKWTRQALPSPSEIANLPKDGGDEFNRLIFESSPYLLQHARNPIDWYPWSDEAFNLAKKTDRPIFLSVGYTTCHWCHVMEHESFEDEAVAAVINENYVCVKVDREERPDVDNVYMTVTQMMTGRGGWPMTVIMSPEKIPFFAGTYFPKDSMMQLLPHFAKVWREDREKAKEVGNAIIKSLSELQANQAGDDLNSTHLDACYRSLVNNFDQTHGGFGRQPKFPTCHTLSFLLRYHLRTGDENALKMVEETLKNIRQGGIYDHVGLGIHRYSTDQEWLLPHFEKMLYDQALFVIANLECHLVTGNPFYLASCRDTLNYVTRKMTSDEGGFFSAEDADSEGEEGKFYLWSTKEIESILGAKDGKKYSARYQFQQDGNYLDEATHQKTGKNIPHLNQNLTEEDDEFEEMRIKLFEEREKRIQPQLDDKVLTDWNGLMISAFARCARSLNDKAYLQIAQKAADFCLSKLRTKDGRLVKRWRRGKAGLPAHLEDYAFLVQGLLDTYEASFETKYLKASIELTDIAIDLFEDEQNGGFFLTADDGESLLVRPKEVYDGAIPSGNSVMAMNLARLSKMTGVRKYEETLFRLFSAFSGFLEKNPQGAELLLQALDFMLSSPLELVLAGDPNKPDTQKILQIINRRFMPSKILLLRDSVKEDSELYDLIPFVQNHKEIDGKATLYACRNQTCDHPRTDPQEIKKFLSQSNKN